jgi:hypothetical protein
LYHGEEKNVGVSKIQTCNCFPYVVRWNHPDVPFIFSPRTVALSH